MAKYKLDSQIKTLKIENENTTSVQSPLPCPNKSLTKKPYATVVKQISILTVGNGGSNNKANNAVNDQKGLLALLESELNQNLTPLPLKYVASILLDERPRV